MPDAHEMIRLTGGSDFWHTPAIESAGLPELMWTDGPHGVRKQSGSSDHLGIYNSDPATCFPPAVGLASSWDLDLIERVGVALGEECRAVGVGVLLGPGTNLKRNPLCGRNFEYFAEDPLLSAALAAALIEGIQSQGVGTSLKHFAANNQETDRMRRDSQVDERTLRELYLRGFEKAIRQAKPWSVMCSYNRVNGTFASEHHWLLTTVLREEWGYEGVVVSDWGAVWSRVRALQAGLDLEMPSHRGHEDAVHAALDDGSLPAATIRRAFDRVADVVRRASEAAADAHDGFDVDGHHELARRMAERCVVLLSNDGVLPLQTGARVAVIGEFARTPRYQGAGSSKVNPTRLDNALDAIRALGANVTFAPGFRLGASEGESKIGAQGEPWGESLGDDQGDDRALRDEATAAAEGADVVLAFLGLGDGDESEGYDREHADLPADQLALLDALLAVNPNVVVVLSNGSSVLLPFAHRVRAIVEGWLLGQAGGSALGDVLFGVVNPSGKTTETIPLRLQDVPSHPHFPGDSHGVRYGEGLFVGYRGYDIADADVAFPFGHGLSYTSFEYAGLGLDAASEGLRVRVEVTNAGARPGREIVQAYVSLPGSRVMRPVRELKGFASVVLEPGATGAVDVLIPLADLAYWDVADGRWVVETGTYTVQVGASSRDLRLTGTVRVQGDEPVRPLTLLSTVSECRANENFAAYVEELAFRGFGGDADALKLLGDAPLATAANFAQVPEPLVLDALAAVNAGRRPAALPER